MSLIIFKITLGILVLLLGFFTIRGLKKTSAYKSDKYENYLLFLIAFESIVLPIWIFL
ncbi:hypothetical protein COM13_05840 [Bacillus pseudomycoides]|nr:hypothetical protein COO07_10660 [Bacillus pseudomycoides]PEE05727.1 hypothetical protein CON86_13905 [Bacillus pseudomycoides]PEK81622.1 hypothetical protein CN597_08075 [Bacillus pseudomycoides]PEM74925.1 hypothetical protein CN632_17180 [Bacillus pseudomycoides]PEN11503.1 hypothetical protein CN640_00755 [Bacillus pseudomycoides]